MVYEASLKHKLDAENTYSTAQRLGHDRGLKEGLKEGQKQAEAKAYAEKLASARIMLGKGICKEDIRDVLGLSIEEIDKL